MKIALSLGADFVATGHYCRKGEFEKDGKTIYQLLAGADNNKDQSYFLCQLSQEQLSKALFPIGELTKPQVREIALELDLVTAEKRDSQGLCFIGKVSLPEFLQQKLQPKEGIIIEIDKENPIYFQEKPKFDSFEDQLEFHSKNVEYSPEMGKIVGKHQGVHYFTIGQRKGLNVGGTKEALFIIATDVENNIIYTGQGHSHPGLYRKTLKVSDSETHWIREDLALKNFEKLDVLARIRYRQELQNATLYQFEDNLFVDFENPQSAITSGQFVAWNLEDELVGSGVIA
jgi:tRNA-specific 2-thiouridylase